MKIMATFFKRHALLPSVTPTLHQATMTHTSTRDSWTLTDKSGLVLLSPDSWCTRGFVCASKSLFTQSCESSGGFLVVLMATSSKRAYAKPMSVAPRAPAPVAGHCWLIPPQDTLKDSKAGLAQSLWSLLVGTRFCLSPPRMSGGYGVWF